MIGKTLGQKLFYRSSDAAMAVPVESEPAFKPGEPEIFFHGKYVPLSTKDGQVRRSA